MDKLKEITMLKFRGDLGLWVTYRARECTAIVMMTLHYCIMVLGT